MNSFFIFLKKPHGWTSQKCLTVFKKKFDFKKVGHHGTLDPFATGLLLVGVGEATKFFRFLEDSQKTYVAKLRFGEETDTLDNTGKVIVKGDIPKFSQEEIFKKIAPLIGEIEQTPPMYSAIKVEGQRLYELARKGQEVERKSRRVNIFDLQIKKWEPPILSFKTTVSRGTYIRALAKQIAGQLGSVGHLIELTRTRLLNHDLNFAFDLESVENIFQRIEIPKLLAHLPTKEFSLSQAKDLIFGKPVPLKESFSSPYVLCEHEGHFLGIAKQDDNNTLKPERLMSKIGVVPM